MSTGRNSKFAEPACEGLQFSPTTRIWTARKSLVMLRLSSCLCLQLKDIEGFEPGQELKVEELFKEGDLVDIAGQSIGKGFQGE